MSKRDECEEKARDDPMTRVLEQERELRRARLEVVECGQQTRKVAQDASQLRDASDALRRSVNEMEARYDAEGAAQRAKIDELRRRRDELKQLKAEQVKKFDDLRGSTAGVDKELSAYRKQLAEMEESRDQGMKMEESRDQGMKMEESRDQGRMMEESRDQGRPKTEMMAAMKSSSFSSSFTSHSSSQRVSSSSSSSSLIHRSSLSKISSNRALSRDDAHDDKLHRE